jgi:hypothetical protein
MMRKFKFEAKIYESLNCLPMAARKKLDAVEIKLHGAVGAARARRAVDNLSRRQRVQRRDGARSVPSSKKQGWRVSFRLPSSSPAPRAGPAIRLITRRRCSFRHARGRCRTRR